MTLDALNNWLLDCGCKPQHIQHIYRAMLGVVPWPQNKLKVSKKLREHCQSYTVAQLSLNTAYLDTREEKEKESAKLLFWTNH